MSRIARVEAWPANAPLEAPYLMAPGTVAGICRTIVRVTTEDGVVGLGESASPVDAVQVCGELGQNLVGRDTADVRAELEPVELAVPAHRTDGKVLIDQPLTGIEIALWDIAAREEGVPLYELLGGACRTAVAFSEYFAYRPGREDTPADVAAFCARMVEEHDSPVFEGKVAVRPVEEDVELVREIRAAIGPDRELRLDANMGWGLDTARRALSLLEPFGIANVEEPVASFEDMAELRRSTSTPFSAHTPDPSAQRRSARPTRSSSVSGRSAALPEPVGSSKRASEPASASGSTAATSGSRRLRTSTSPLRRHTSTGRVSLCFAGPRTM